MDGKFDDTEDFTVTISLTVINNVRINFMNFNNVKVGFIETFNSNHILFLSEIRNILHSNNIIYDDNDISNVVYQIRTLISDYDIVNNFVPYPFPKDYISDNVRKAFVKVCDNNTITLQSNIKSILHENNVQYNENEITHVFNQMLNYIRNL